MKRAFFERFFDEVKRKVDSCKGKPEPDDPVASGGRKSIGSVGSGTGSGQCDSKLDRTFCQTLNIE